MDKHEWRNAPTRTGYYVDEWGATEYPLDIAPAPHVAIDVPVQVCREILRLAEENERLRTALALAENGLLATVYETDSGTWEPRIKEGYDIPEIKLAMDAIRAIRPCLHRPSGMEDIVGTSCRCGVSHSRKEQCARCGAWVPWHDFPGRDIPKG